MSMDSGGLMPRRRRRYRIHKRRFIPFVILSVLFILLAVLLYYNLAVAPWAYGPHDFASEHLHIYFTTEAEQGVPWVFLAAADLAERIPKDEIRLNHVRQRSLQFTGMRLDGPWQEIVREVSPGDAFLRQMRFEVKRLQALYEIFADKTFPIPAGYAYAFEDGYGAARSYGGDRYHEGIDIFCGMEVPVLSVGAGVIEQLGWNELGGWRLGIRGEDGIYYYYAHLKRYEGRPRKGMRVERGQIIAYAGDSGYGPEGTTGRFEPHLHFGMYTGKGRNLQAFNPYPFLRAWEQ